MEKHAMREYLAELESRIDKALKKWKKERIENGEVVHLAWQFERSHIIMDVFWHDKKERVELECKRPDHKHQDYTFKDLDEDTSDRVIDRIGNFAQVVMGIWQKSLKDE